MPDGFNAEPRKATAGCQNLALPSVGPGEKPIEPPERRYAAPMPSQRRRGFRACLLAWYDEHARDLPWRRTSDPYAIWVSEVMLQQTRVAAVIERYSAFLDRFPTVASLAAANESEVLTLWSGLGYYRRARMMLRAAKVQVEEHDAEMPRTAADLKSLPGIGSYTSAAIASIAFDEPVAVVDGNVERVIMRLAGWGETLDPAEPPLRRRIQREAASLLDSARPGHFNQAMMELGATICLPRAPLCLQCPVFDFCATRGEHATLPRRKRTSRKIGFALVRRNETGAAQSAQELLLEQRPASETVMSGMWELPGFDVSVAHSELPVLQVKHAIMQTNYSVAVVALSEEELHLAQKNEAIRRWFRPGGLAGLPLTGLARKVLIAMDLFPGKPARATRR